MSKVKEIELTLNDKSKIIIPIWNKKAYEDKRCHINKIYNSNNVIKIQINFFDDYTRSYDVVKSHIRRKNNRKIRKRKRVIK